MISAYQDLHTHLNRSRHLTGSFDRISIITSSGRSLFRVFTLFFFLPRRSFLSLLLLDIFAFLSSTLRLRSRLRTKSFICPFLKVPPQIHNHTVDLPRIFMMDVSREKMERGKFKVSPYYAVRPVFCSIQPPCDTLLMSLIQEECKKIKLRTKALDQNKKIKTKQRKNPSCPTHSSPTARVLLDPGVGLARPTARPTRTYKKTHKIQPKKPIFNTQNSFLMSQKSFLIHQNSFIMPQNLFFDSNLKLINGRLTLR